MEAAFLATKADIREEIDRLKTHVASGRALLETGGPMGRKLDFLSQEFNRESNTLCSKSNAGAVTADGAGAEGCGRSVPRAGSESGVDAWRPRRSTLRHSPPRPDAGLVLAVRRGKIHDRAQSSGKRSGLRIVDQRHDAAASRQRDRRTPLSLSPRAASSRSCATMTSCWNRPRSTATATPRRERRPNAR
jgi:hypothetical protein